MFLMWNPEAAAVREDGQVSFQADNLREETARAPLHSLCSNPAVVEISLLRIVLEACPQVCCPPSCPHLCKILTAHVTLLGTMA